MYHKLKRTLLLGLLICLPFAALQAHAAQNEVWVDYPQPEWTRHDLLTIGQDRSGSIAFANGFTTLMDESIQTARRPLVACFGGTGIGTTKRIDKIIKRSELIVENCGEDMPFLFGGSDGFGIIYDSIVTLDIGNDSSVRGVYGGDRNPILGPNEGYYDLLDYNPAGRLQDEMLPSGRVVVERDKDGAILRSDGSALPLWAQDGQPSEALLYYPRASGLDVQAFTALLGEIAVEDVVDYNSADVSIGATHVLIKSGRVLGNVVGGGTSNPNLALPLEDEVLVVNNLGSNHIGTSNVTIAGGIIENGAVYGGSVTLGDSVGNANVYLEGGSIGGNVYAGGILNRGYHSLVTGTASVFVRGGSDYDGYIQTGSANRAVLRFQEYSKAYQGNFGTRENSFDLLSVEQGSELTLAAGQHHAYSWNIAEQSSLRFATGQSIAPGGLQNNGQLVLQEDVHLVLQGGYTGGAGSGLQLRWGPDTPAYLNIAGKATGQTQLHVVLPYNLQAARINLIEASAQSPANAFVMRNLKTSRGSVVFGSELAGNRRIWYLAFPWMDGQEQETSPEKAPNTGVWRQLFGWHKG